MAGNVQNPPLVRLPRTAGTPAARSLVMTVWEYKVLEPNMKIRDRIEVMEREFNRLGEDGWELCSDHGGSYTFKRPRPGTAS
jgi:hypothetical protein